MNFLGRERALSLVLALYLLGAVVYSIVTPIFEAGDEIWHYPFIQYLATTGRLPVQDPLHKGLWEQEGGQPPLYYAVGALATFWIDTHDLTDRLWLNPHAQIGVPLAFGNKNMIVHTAAENFPWQGATLAVHLIRFISILFGAGTVLFTYLTAVEVLAQTTPGPAGNQSSRREAWPVGTPESRYVNLPLLAAALVAFNPMFIFIMASVNNDSLATALASLSLWLIVRLVSRGATTKRYLALGITLGLGALTKESVLGLAAIFAVVFLYLLWKNRKGGEILRAAVTPLLVIGIALWWYIRNWQLYGDPTGLNVWLAIAGPRIQAPGLLELAGEFQGFRISFWGNFGGVNIIAPDWVYLVLDAFTLIALIGLVAGVARKRLPPRLVIPALWVAVEFVLLIRWTLTTFASQGRLMFPALSAIGILLAFGLGEMTRLVLGSTRDSFAQLPAYSLALVLFLFSAVTPFALIAPNYRLPPRVDETSVPNPVHINFENQAELVGYAMPQRTIQPNGELPITLYWKALAVMDEDYSVYIHLFGAQGDLIGQWDAFPGRGLYPTRLWAPNEVVVDEYRVPLGFGARGGQVGRVEAGLYRKKGLANLVARDPNGNLITPTLARFKIAGVLNAPASTPTLMTFGSQIALARAEVRIDSNITVNLAWHALRAPDKDYTVFVHLVDAQGQTIAQADSQPQNNSYPTSFWDAGQVIEDSYVLNAPRGVYRIEIGLYDATGTRLPNDRGGDKYVVEDVRVP